MDRRRAAAGRRRWWEPARAQAAEAWLGRTGNDRGDPAPHDDLAVVPRALAFADRILSLEDGRLTEAAA
jgi:hypothetical protein